MRHLFTQVLNMSMTGSVVILLVMLVRFLLRRSPKIYSYMLWSVVLFRLLCPVAFTAPVSALNAFQPEVKEASEGTSVVSFLPSGLTQSTEVSFVPSDDALPKQTPETGHVERIQAVIVTGLWIAGTAAMLLYSVFQYLRLRIKLVGAIRQEGNVYLADHIDTPFAMGILWPRIYLPSNIPTKEQKYIIAHERHHISRLDHVIKLLAYLALCIHWFNPLVWTAFILAGKDMEMSCDEAVIRKLGPQIRADYSASLLRLATHRKIISGMPLAFGEGDTKGRIMNMAKWKKPKVWVSMICMALCAAVLVACAVNPQDTGSNTEPLPELKNTDNEYPTVTVDGNEVITNVELIKFGPLAMALPDELETIEENGILVLKKDGKTVGGIGLRHQEQANSPDSFSREWQAAIGVPEASDSSMGYMGGSAEYADYETTYFMDMPVNRDDSGNIIMDEQGTYVMENEVTHYFFLNGTDVYDLWIYPNRIPAITRETILKSCVLQGVTDIAAMESALATEKEALAQCRSVLEQIQSTGAYKIETRQENGPFALNETAITTAWGSGDSRMYLIVIPESGGSSSFGGLLADGLTFECDSARQWRETTIWEWQDPWLVSFQWDDSAVAYMDTLTEDTGTTVMLRIDKPFGQGEQEQPHYYVNFRFNKDGAFLSVYIQTNLFMENSVTKTESIASLDADTIHAEIQAEYRKAVG